MDSRRRVFIGVFIVSTALFAVYEHISAQAPTVGNIPGLDPNYQVPRTPWGHPDLQGIMDGGSMTPLERSDEHKGKEFLTDAEIKALEAAAIANPGRNARVEDRFADLAGAYNDVFTHRRTNYGRTKRTSLVIDPPDGRIPPLTSAAQAARKQAAAREGRASVSAAPRKASFAIDADEAALVARTGGFDNPEDRHNDRCMGIGMAPTVSVMRLVQAPDSVMVYYEYAIAGGGYRTIHLDGRAHLPPNIRQKYGHSIGRWEGDTLVIDSRNFSDETNFQGARLVPLWQPDTTKNLHLIERFRRVADDLILYQITVDDPETFTRTWTQEVGLTILPNKANQVYESACHEGNYSLTAILAGGRAGDREKETGSRKRK